MSSLRDQNAVLEDAILKNAEPENAGPPTDPPPRANNVPQCPPCRQCVNLYKNSESLCLFHIKLHNGFKGSLSN